jgi:uncharacterized protein (TIGR00251 family)
MVLFCQENRGVLRISLHVQPRAKKTEIVGVHGDALKVKVAAPPVEGAANEALVEYFAAFLSVPRSRVQLGRGDKSRKKVIEVQDVSAAQLTDLLIKHGLLAIKLG